LPESSAAYNFRRRICQMVSSLQRDGDILATKGSRILMRPHQNQPLYTRRMGLLTRFTATEIATTPEDAAALRDVLSAVGTVDGSVDSTEYRLIEALFRTIPQLRDHAGAGAPPRANRDHILGALAKLGDERLRRQCWVLAVELAIASEGVNEAEE